MQYFLHSIPQDRPAAIVAGVLPVLAARLAGDEADVREAALHVAVELARDTGCLAKMQACEELRIQVRTLQMRLDTLDKLDWAAAQEEVEALKALSEQLEGEQVALPDGSLPTVQDISAHRVAVVDDSSTTGASPSALQMVPVELAEEAIELAAVLPTN